MAAYTQLSQCLSFMASPVFMLTQDAAGHLDGFADVSGFWHGRLLSRRAIIPSPVIEATENHCSIYVRHSFFPLLFRVLKTGGLAAAGLTTKLWKNLQRLTPVEGSARAWYHDWLRLPLSRIRGICLYQLPCLEQMSIIVIAPCEEVLDHRSCTSSSPRITASGTRSGAYSLGPFSLRSR